MIFLRDRIDKRDFTIEKSILQNAFLTWSINPTVAITARSAHLESRSRARREDLLSCSSGCANNWRSGVAHDSGSNISTTGEERDSRARKKSPYGRSGMVGRVPQCGCTLSHHRTSSPTCSFSFLYVTAATMNGRQIRPRKSFLRGSLVLPGGYFPREVAMQPQPRTHFEEDGIAMARYT